MKRMMIALLMGMALFVVGTQAQSVEAARYFDHGVEEMERGRNVDALKYFRTARKAADRSQVSPEFRAMIHYNTGVCLYRLGERAAAEREYRTALRLKNGRYEKAFYALGVVRSERGINSARAANQ